MSSQLPLPDLPPMQAMPSPGAPAPVSVPAAMPSPSRQAYGLKRLRQLVAYVGGASLGFVLLVCGAELTFREDLRPTTLLATIEARTDLNIFNQKLGVEPGKLVLTEADYRAKLAEAEREGQAKAELLFQRELAGVQADKERVVGAYQTLYQRATAIAQAGLQMEAQAMMFRQRLIEMTNGGRAAVISFKDDFCGLGSAEACESARDDRRVMIEEGEARTQTDLAAKINKLMAGIEDPAAFVTRDDLKQNGTPAISR